MLEKIFGSKTRVILLRLFINNPDRFYFVREITRNLNLHLNSIRRELANLENLGIVASFTKEDWEKEIASLFVKEFGEKDILVEISW